MSLVESAPPGGPLRQSATALHAEALDGVRLAARLRIMTVPVVMVLLLIVMRDDRSLLFVEACLVVFMLAGLVQIAVVRSDRYRPWHGYVAVAFDMALLGFAIFGSQFLFDHPWPEQTLLHSRPVVFYFFVMATVALSLSPLLMLWAGALAALSWSAGVLWLVSLPDTIVFLPAGLPMDERLALSHQPTFIGTSAWANDVVALLLTSFVLAGVVWRSRRLVTREIEVARERANLARHFPPSMVDEIAHHDGMLERVRRQRVAVMFVDVVGFTRLAEALDAEATVAILRGLHRRLETAVFDHGGTLDKFLGDGVMATFGTPRPSGRDAANAIGAARSALAAADKWNAKRTARGAQPIRLAVGLHIGEVVLGDVGSERRLEYAVIGDTVNVAARLEQLARPLEARIVASDELVAAAREQDADLAGFEPAGEHELRGRAAPVAVWRLPL